MISTPVFGSELFVAHDFCRIKNFKTQRQVIHKYSQISMGALVVGYRQLNAPAIISDFVRSND
jgi:hypothetical protein